ncbi:Gfo/Idh/MocA family oxidoreductase [Cohnella pontilimi]|uniref:Gfo/Idh/MocA family oxidoreductase n=1 Tax=Cohnella pontilimi TaxID=2564100 RepID=A0A4U0FFZ0_9BACL|nr:Gfo/Idh/MocA family oxidoreductase [Cohnella pontilimi]TJY42282.1 Gfo/Idh/MocA family oxidoreductase [Cohnella pontilimi]
MIRFGVVGTNWITDQFIESARKVSDFSLSAVYSRTEERAAEFAAKHGVSRTFTDLGTMADSGEIDAVYIASPNSLHAEQSILFMNKGIHVLCEKPAASNAGQFRQMVEAAASNHVLLMEALKSTFLPNFVAIEQNLHKLGKVRRYFASYCQYSSRYDAYKQGNLPNAFNPQFSNGALMDLGIYCIYPMVALFGVPDEVKATGVMLDSGVDGEGSILLKYADMEAVVLYSKITESSLPSEIQGENGSMIIHKISQPQKVEIRMRDGTVEDITQPQDPLTMRYEVEEFIRLIQSGRLESGVNTHARSLAALEIMDEARRQMGLVFPAD